MEPPSSCSLRTRITFAVIGAFVGLSIFVCFGGWYRNWDAAVWGLASGILAGVSLAVHVVYLRTEWRTRPTMLRPLMLLGCFGQLAGVASFAVYLALAIVQHQALTPYGQGYYVACVWSAMTWKWGFILFLYSRSYKRLYEFASGLAVNDTPYQKV